jgi:hypothetical protein
VVKKVGPRDAKASHLRCLTFELTRPERLGALPAGPMMTKGGAAGKAPSRGGSRVERGVRPHSHPVSGWLSV